MEKLQTNNLQQELLDYLESSVSFILVEDICSAFHLYHPLLVAQELDQLFQENKLNRNISFISASVSNKGNGVVKKKENKIQRLFYQYKKIF